MHTILLGHRKEKWELQVLKMDYKNDLFFGDRRYNKIDNSDGTISLEDVTEYRVVGDSFGAGDMIEIRNSSTNELIKKIPISQAQKAVGAIDELPGFLVNKEA